MKTKNKLLTLLVLSAGAACTTAAINKFIKMSAISKHLLDKPKSYCFSWRLGKIHYTKAGSGKPLLLVHDLNAISSGVEWEQITKELQKKYTVYTIDLLGCGRSEKPIMTYTNYLYVQLLSDFIKSEIGHRTDVIATGGSSALAIMACNSNPDLFDRMMFINPDSMLACSQIPGKSAKTYKFILDLPIIGTLLYHIATSKQALTEEFVSDYFYNPYSFSRVLIDAYYESAHLGESPKSIYASVRCNYTKCNIVNALKKIDNSIYLVGGSEVEDIKEILDEYKEYNSSIETTIIPQTKALPQLERPEEVLKAIDMFF